MASSGADSSPATRLDAAEPPTNVRWVILLLLMLMTAMFHFNRNSINVAGAEHIIKNPEREINDYDVSATQMGLVYTSYLIIYTVMMVPGGWLIERIGPKGALLFLGFGFAVFVPVTGLVGYWLPPGSHTMAGSLLGLPMIVVALCAIRGLLGVFGAPMHPGAARAVSYWLPYGSRGLGNGLVTGAAVVGAALTPPIFGFLSDRHFFGDDSGWRSALVVAGIVTGLLTLVWAFYGADRPARHSLVNASERRGIEAGDPAIGVPVQLAGSAATGFWSMLIEKNMILLNLSYAAYSYSQYLFFNWAQYYITNTLHYSVQDSRLWTTGITLSMAAGMLFGGLSADRMQAIFGSRRGRAITPLCGMTISGLLLMLAVFSPWPLGSIVGFGLSMAMLGLCEASFWTTALEIGKDRAALSGSILNAGGNAGGLLAPTFTPLLSLYLGWQGSLALAGGISMLGGLFWIWIHLQEAHPSVREL